MKSNYEKDLPGKIPFGASWGILRFVLPVLLGFIGLQISTQSFAGMMNYDESAVYPPMLYILGYPLYNPLFYILGFFKYIYIKGMYVYYLKSIRWFLYFGIIALCQAIIHTAIINHISRRQNTMHGTARKATEKELAERGYMNRHGVVLAQTYNAKVTAKKIFKSEDSQTGELVKKASLSLKCRKPGKLICHSGDVHTFIAAPSGTGKNIGPIFATLLNYYKQVFVLDPKGENFDTTSKFRSKFSRIIRFDPTDKYRTLRINPVNEIRDGIDYAYADCNAIADAIIPAGDPKNIYFTDSAKGIVTSALLHIRYSDFNDKSLGGLRDFLSSGSENDFNELLNSKNSGNPNTSSALGKAQAEAMASTKHFFIVTEKMWKKENYKYKNPKTGEIEIRNRLKDQGYEIGQKMYSSKLDDLVRKGAADILSTNHKELASVWKTIAAAIQLFDEEGVRFATSESDFEIDDFFNTDKPISFYFTVPYSDLGRLSPIVKIIITLILKRLMEGTTGFGTKRLPFDLLFILDEFPVLRKFELIAEIMGISRGYNCFFMIICQTMKQLVEIYGPNHPFMDHCQVHLYYAPDDVGDAERISRAIGNETVHEEKVSRNGALKIGSSNLNYSDNNMGRALFDAADILRLPPECALIRIQGMQVYIAKKEVFYNDFRFKNKAAREGLEIEELYAEAAGLPSRKRKAAAIAKNKALEESMEENRNEKPENDPELLEDAENDLIVASINENQTFDEDFEMPDEIDFSFDNEEEKPEQPQPETTEENDSSTEKELADDDDSSPDDLDWS